MSDRKSINRESEMSAKEDDGNGKNEESPNSVFEPEAHQDDMDENEGRREERRRSMENDCYVYLKDF